MQAKKSIEHSERKSYHSRRKNGRLGCPFPQNQVKRITDYMENILVIKHGALGDFILSIGRMMLLKDMYPDARITLMTSTPYLAIGQQMGVFSDFIVDNRRYPIFVNETCRIMRALRKGRFSKVYDMQRTQRTKTYRRLFRMLMPSGEVDWYTYGAHYHLTKRAKLLPAKEEAQEWQMFYKVPDLSFMHGKAENFHLLPERYVLLIPGCSPQHPHKRWPVESYREIVRRVASLGLHCVVIGTNAERAECDAICRDMPNTVNMVGLTDIMDIPQVARRAMAVLGNDTGPTHMASLSGVFTIGVFDYRHAQAKLRHPDCKSLISENVISLITPDMVWEHLEPRLRA